MKAYVDLTINGHAVAVEVDYSYDIDPDPVVTTVTLGGTEILGTLTEYDMKHLNWCAAVDWARSAHNPNWRKEK
jgi:hypothetical protein